jgi:hypothetical protein
MSTDKTDSGWRKRQIALDKKAENARQLGLDYEPRMNKMKEEWLMAGAVVPVDVETTAALVAEIKRLINVVGGMALAQPAKQEPVACNHEWVDDTKLKPQWRCIKCGAEYTKENT